MGVNLIIVMVSIVIWPVGEMRTTIGLQEMMTVVTRMEDGKKSRIIEKASPFDYARVISLTLFSVLEK